MRMLQTLLSCVLMCSCSYLLIRPIVCLAATVCATMFLNPKARSVVSGVLMVVDLTVAWLGDQLQAEGVMSSLQWFCVLVLILIVHSWPLLPLEDHRPSHRSFSCLNHCVCLAFTERKTQETKARIRGCGYSFFGVSVCAGHSAAPALASASASSLPWSPLCPLT